MFLGREIMVCCSGKSNKAPSTYRPLTDTEVQPRSKPGKAHISCTHHHPYILVLSYLRQQLKHMTLSMFKLYRFKVFSNSIFIEPAALTATHMAAHLTPTVSLGSEDSQCTGRSLYTLTYMGVGGRTRLQQKWFLLARWLTCHLVRMPPAGRRCRWRCNMSTLARERLRKPQS